jgi:hypothetical protein
MDDGIGWRWKRRSERRKEEDSASRGACLVRVERPRAGLKKLCGAGGGERNWSGEREERACSHRTTISRRRNQGGPELYVSGGNT